MSTATIGRAREYLPIPGYPGYEMSAAGVVRSWIPWKGTPTPRTLRQYPNPKGYLVVRLQQKTLTVHRLLAVTFLGDHPGELVRHLNDDRLDNRLENLAWGTKRDNGRDAVRNGKHFQASLTHCAKAGHPLSGSNLYVSPKSGKRLCRACRNTRQRALRAAA